MTIRGKCWKGMCVDRGLWPDEAAAVVEEQRKASDADMQRRWNDPVSDYPTTMMAVLFLATSDYAVKWIDANEPRHFARGNFV